MANWRTVLNSTDASPFRTYFSLFVSNANGTDYGAYSCAAMNSLGKIKADITVLSNRASFLRGTSKVIPCSTEPRSRMKQKQPMRADQWDSVARRTEGPTSTIEEHNRPGGGVVKENQASSASFSAHLTTTSLLLFALFSWI